MTDDAYLRVAVMLCLIAAAWVYVLGFSLIAALGVVWAIWFAATVSWFMR